MSKVKRIPLGEVGTFQRGGNFKKSDFIEDGYPCIHYGQIHTKFGTSTYSHLTSIPESIATKCPKAAKGDLIIAITSEDVAGSCKCTTWLADYKVALGGHIARFRHNFDPQYVAYFFQSPSFQKEKGKYTHGFKVTEIKPSDIGKIEIPEHDLTTQKEIAKKLEYTFNKLDQIKINSTKALHAATDIFNQQLYQIMEGYELYEQVTIGNTFKTYSGGTPLKSNTSYYNNGKIPWLMSGEVCKKYIYKTERFITDEGLQNSSAKFYPIDTVMVAMYGANAAQVGILKLEATSNQAVCGILPNEKYLPEFVYYWLLYKQKYLASLAQGGAQPNISQIKIKRLTIPIIDIEEQRRITNILEQISLRVECMKRNLTQLGNKYEELKQAILKETFE